MSRSSLRPLFFPASVAVVGASRDEAAIGRKVLRALRDTGFPGPVYPINPKAVELESLRCYPSVAAAPRPVDLAILAIPARQVLSAVDDCHAAGVKALVVISAGFAETGEEGKALQRALLDKARAYGMRLVGPNCFGVLNTAPEAPLNASFSSRFAVAGHTAMASQSGAMGLAILGLAREQQLGLSTYVSMGNKADVSSNDLLEYWEQDERTRVILLYLESFGNPARFATIARRVARTKPIIALKSGRGRAGTRAAGSHTAALAASDVAVDAIFRQTGVIRAETVEEMFQLATALDCQPPPRGKRVGIVTNAGGPAILCADACEAAGLEVPELSPETKSALMRFLPPAASAGNPVDLIASATSDLYRKAIEVLLAAEELDALVVLHSVIDRDVPSDLEPAIAEGVMAGRRGSSRPKPVFLCLMKDSRPRAPLVAGAERVPVYLFPEEAARALGKMASYSLWRLRPEGTFPPEMVVDRKRFRAAAGPWLPPSEVEATLREAGLPVLDSATVSGAAAAVELAEKLGFPVAMKLVSRTITHKTDVGGVQLDLRDAAAVRTAFETIRANLERHAPKETLEAVLIQPMAPKGVELFVGMVRDPVFGPLVGFGLGGIFVEALGDLRFRVAPLTDADAVEMIRGIKGFRILEGYRGLPGADLDALKAVILKVSALGLAAPEILSLDLNPVVALPPGKGCLVLDARVQVRG